MYHKHLKAGFASGLYVLSLMLGMLIESALAARFLPEKQLSIWFLFLSVQIFFNYFDFGLSPALSREVGLACKKHDPAKRIANLLHAIIKFNHASAGLICVIALFTISMLGLSAWLIHCLLILLFAYLLRLLANPYLACVYGMRQVTIERMSRAASPLTGLLLSCLFLYLGYGLTGLVVSLLLRNVLLFVLAYVNYFRLKLAVTGRLDKRLAKCLWRRLFSQCWQWSAINLGGYLIFQSGNWVIAGRFGLIDVAQYSVCVQMITATRMLASLMQTGTLPYVSKAYAQGEQKQVSFLLFNQLRINVLLASAILMVIFLYRDYVIAIWLGKQFYLSKSLLLFLLLTCFFEVVHVSLATTATACGYLKFTGPALTAGVLTLLLAYCLSLIFGLVGIGLAIFITQLMTNNWYVPYRCFQFFNISYQKVLPHVIYLLVRVAIMLAIIAGGKYLLLTYALSSDVLVLALGVVSALIPLAICCWPNIRRLNEVE